ncbi:MAG: hypothetical protein OEW75_02805 [Cyclobacteriaceae bacterium]|nr:hypothetical protein [Cyclobacteriaceae bacterium]
MMNRIFLLFLVFLLLNISPVFSQQEEKPYKLKKNAISISVLGTSTFVGFTYERIFLQKISLEGGIGFIGFGGGISYYFSKLDQPGFKFFTGLKYTAFAGLLADSGSTSGVYLPFGVKLFSRNWFGMGIDIGPGVFILQPGYDFGGTVNNKPSTVLYPHGNLKLSVMF